MQDTTNYTALDMVSAAKAAWELVASTWEVPNALWLPQGVLGPAVQGLAVHHPPAPQDSDAMDVVNLMSSKEAVRGDHRTQSTEHSDFFRQLQSK